MGKLLLTLPLSMLLVGQAAIAQKYDGERPPKPDIPYLLHGDQLVETEIADARIEDRKKETANILPGSSSPVRTPLAEPIFIFESDKIAPQKLALYEAEVVKGQREVTFPKDPRDQARKGPHPKHVLVKKLEDKLFWVEVNQVLDIGQYCLSPQGSQAVFCFEVY